MKVADFVASFDFSYSVIDFLIITVSLFVIISCCSIDCFAIADSDWSVVDYFGLKN